MTRAVILRCCLKSYRREQPEQKKNMDTLKIFFGDQKTVFWSVCTAATALVVIYFVIIPQAHAFIDVGQQLKQLQGRSQALNTKLAALQAEDENADKENLQVALTILPTEEKVTEALITVQDLLAKSGMALYTANYTTQRTKVGSGFTLSVVAKGDMNGVRSFLSSLDSAPRIFRVNSIDVRSDLSNHGVMDAEIPLSVFYEPLSGAISTGNLDKPLPQLSAQDKQLLEKLTGVLAQFPESASGSAVEVGKDNPFESSQPQPTAAPTPQPTPLEVAPTSTPSASLQG